MERAWPEGKEEGREGRTGEVHVTERKGGEGREGGRAGGRTELDEGGAKFFQDDAQVPGELSFLVEERALGESLD